MATKSKKTTSKKTNTLNNQEQLDATNPDKAPPPETLSTEDTTNLRGEMIDKETPTSLPIDSKTGKEVPAPKDVSGEGVPPADSDGYPFMVGTSIYTGGTR